MAFPTGWDYKQKLTIQNAKVPGTLSDFPVLITRTELHNDVVDPSGSNEAQANGGDIRFSSDSAGTNQLACEVLSFEHDTTTAAGDAQIEIWVSVASVSSSVDTDIYIWYNTTGSDTQPGVATTYGRDAVWSDYEAVLHMSTAVDSTGNHTPSFSGIAASSDAFGGSDGAQVTNNNIDEVQITGITTINEPFTLQSWGYIGTDAETRLVGVADNSVANQQLNVGTDYSGSVGALLQAYNGSEDLITTSSYQGQDTWRHYHGVCTADDDRELFVNGATAGTSTTSKSLTGLDTLSIFVSGDSTPYGRQPMRSDEARLRLSALSSNWITAEYNNQSSPSTFIVDSTPEATTGGAAALETSVSGNASIAAALTTSIDMVAAATCSATATAELTTGIPLEAAASASATITAALTTSIDMVAAATCSATATAELTTGIPLEAAASVNATTTADLTAGTGGAELVASATCSATAAAELTTGIPLEAATNASAIQAAALTTSIDMVAAATCSCTATADLTTGIPLAASVIATCGTVAPLTTSIDMVATANIQAITLANLFTGNGVGDVNNPRVDILTTQRGIEILTPQRRVHSLTLDRDITIN